MSMIRVSERAIAKERARERAFPEAWMTRLRDVSPISTWTSHLVPRWMPDVEQWVLYQCIPSLHIPDERRTQLATYWEDLPVTQRFGRRAMVSDYQYRMYHDFRVDARPFLILQGDRGGTPARYTRREQLLLQAHHLPDTPPRMGTLAYAPFDERTVTRILERDRLVEAGRNIDALRRMDSLIGQKAIEAEADKAFRQAFLDWWAQEMGPIAEQFGSLLRHGLDQEIRKATPEEAYAANRFHDHFMETGEVPAPVVHAIRG